MEVVMNRLKKLIIFFIVIIIAGAISIILINFNYKNEQNGNNKNIQEIEEYFLNINEYNAKIQVTVTSNKNVNFYELSQEVKENKRAKQIANSPEDISGIEMSYENGILQVKNSKYNLTKIYNDYPYISNNQLFLTSFLEGYKSTEEKKIEEKEDKIIMSYKSGENKYNNTQVLYINKISLKPESLEILDVNKDCKVNILYKEIELGI